MMNDFTKEELENLLNWGEAYTEFGSSWTDKTQRPLIDKIQSMIDNYCKHDWSVGFGTIHSPVTYCKKCYCQKPAVPNDIFVKMMECIP